MNKVKSIFNCNVLASIVALSIAAAVFYFLSVLMSSNSMPIMILGIFEVRPFAVMQMLSIGAIGCVLYLAVVEILPEVFDKLMTKIDSKVV